MKKVDRGGGRQSATVTEKVWVQLATSRSAEAAAGVGFIGAGDETPAMIFFLGQVKPACIAPF